MLVMLVMASKGELNKGSLSPFVHTIRTVRSVNVFRSRQSVDYRQI
jgi:hypothetical protein